MGMGQVIDYSQFVLQIEKAIANGVATLDENTKIPKVQIDLDASDVGAIADSSNELIALQALSDTSGFLKKTGDGTYSIDISSYLSLAGGAITGDLISTSTTPSTSTTTGAIRTASLGVAGGIFTGTINSSAYNNISIGRGRAAIATNVAIGLGALSNTTSGNTSCGFGVNSLLSLTSGSNCCGIGNDSLSANINGSNASAAGVNAGRYQSNGVNGLTTTDNSCFFGANTKGTQSATNENVFGYNATGNGSNTVTIGDSNITNNFFRGALSVNETQVVSTRKTGWVAATGTPTRTTFDTETVTLLEIARRFKALQDDLISHGLIGA